MKDDVGLDGAQINPLTAEVFLGMQAEFLSVSADIPEVSWTAEHFLSERKRKFELSFWLGAKDHVKAYAVMSEVTTKRVHIHHFMVAEQYRDHGLGSKMIDAAIARARGGGAEILSLKVPTLFKSSHRFYRRHGFVDKDDEGMYMYMELSLKV